MIKGIELLSQMYIFDVARWSYLECELVIPCSAVVITSTPRSLERPRRRGDQSPAEKTLFPNGKSW